MMKYSFKDNINYFAEQLSSELPEEDIKEGVVELMLDNNRVTLTSITDSFRIAIDLGMLVGPIDLEHLKELTSANFLGVNTGGCTFTLDNEGTTLTLIATTSSATPPKENWDWLHRVYSIAQQWTEQMSSWEEFTPLTTFTATRPHVPTSESHTIFKA